MKLLYFAWVRERIGLKEEEVEPPASVATVGDLVDLAARPRAGIRLCPVGAAAIRIALDRVHAANDMRDRRDARGCAVPADDRRIAMAAAISFRVQTEDFDIDAEMARVKAAGRRRRRHRHLHRHLPRRRRAPRRARTRTLSGHGRGRDRAHRATSGRALAGARLSPSSIAPAGSRSATTSSSS